MEELAQDFITFFKPRLVYLILSVWQFTNLKCDRAIKKSQAC